MCYDTENEEFGSDKHHNSDQELVKDDNQLNSFVNSGTQMLEGLNCVFIFSLIHSPILQCVIKFNTISVEIRSDKSPILSNASSLALIKKQVHFKI